MRFKLLLVGGGLQNALIALAVLRKDPQASLAVVERDGRLGGNHTWSFHASDVAPGLSAVMEDSGRSHLAGAHGGLPRNPAAPWSGPMPPFARRGSTRS